MGCSIFGAPLRASTCLSTLQCLKNLTFLWVWSQVSKQGHPLLRHQRSTPDCPCSSKKNTRTGQEPALGRTTLQMNPSPNQPHNLVQKFWERKGIERAGIFHAIFQLSPLNSPSSPNQVFQFSSSTPRPVFVFHPWSLRFGSSYLHSPHICLMKLEVLCEEYGALEVSKPDALSSSSVSKHKTVQPTAQNTLL